VDDLEEGIARYVEPLDRQSPHAIRQIKQLFHDTRDRRSDEREVEAFAACLSSEDGQEGGAGFLEKRPPGWTGRGRGGGRAGGRGRRRCSARSPATSRWKSGTSPAGRWSTSAPPASTSRTSWCGAGSTRRCRSCRTCSAMRSPATWTAGG